MKILLANPRGFCAGVYMAIDVVDQLLDICGDEKIYVYHEIVHNRHVVQRFRDRGAVFVESMSEVPDGATVVFSAHGVSPAVRAEARAKKLTAIDATRTTRKSSARAAKRPTRSRWSRAPTTFRTSPSATRRSSST
jgi:4-hydroxy-3-methylbut-2-enyl diphosphate reductase